MRVGYAAVLAAAAGIVAGAAADRAAENGQVTVHKDGTIVMQTAAARFTVSAEGCVHGARLRDGRALTLDDERAGECSEEIVIDGKVAGPFRGVETAAPEGGDGGPVRIRIRAQNADRTLERIVELETSSQFPEVLTETATYRNLGLVPVQVGPVVTERHWLDAGLSEAGAKPYEMWSFAGASEKWGEDDVVELAPGFARENRMGQAIEDGHGGGVPVAAFWNRNTGLAVGHLDTRPLTLFMPVRVEGGRPRVELTFRPKIGLNPGEHYTTPRTFLGVFDGDYYDPLRTYSRMLQHGGWNLVTPSSEAYAASWCGWGYESEVTPAEMLGAVPKLKEFGIHWATLDDRWFDAYGDWNPRADTFPGDSLRKMVSEYHRNGIRVQLWWLPLAVELSGQKYESHTYSGSQVARDHPEWLLLDIHGKPALTVRGLAMLCPAAPEVRQYYKQLTQRFIRDWGFDGNKLDNVFSVPMCYNPAHHHWSPRDPVMAMGDIYKTIYETTRALKPESVTQTCSCGTPPNIAWLRFQDQAVTADPVGAAQVRRRIKMYKALLGPRAAVYGDHVELTEVAVRGGREYDTGRDFASTIGAGGVVGTKFVWPQTEPRFADVALTPDKDAVWKKWLGIYSGKMLSSGEFRNLYKIGYDKPEGYAIEKAGKMYYAFFTARPDESWSGKLELRGLAPGKYRLLDYANGVDLGMMDGSDARVGVTFTGNLLLEVEPVK